MNERLKLGTVAQWLNDRKVSDCCWINIASSERQKSWEVRTGGFSLDEE